MRLHLTLAFLLLFWLDGLVTYLGVTSLGLREANPVVSSIMTTGPLAAIIAMKAGGSALIMVLLGFLQPRHAILALAGSASAYAGLLLYNLVVILWT